MIKYLLSRYSVKIIVQRILFFNEVRKSSFLMRIVHNLALFALLSGICTSRQKAKKMEKLLNLPKEILPDMKGQLSTQGIREISKILKV